MSKFDVCIVTYNNEQDIAYCIESVKKQTYPIGKLIIVDNASNDNTLEIIRSYQDDSHIIVLIENKQNIGYVKGQNMAISLTESEYVLCLNPDVELDEHYLMHMAEVLKRDQTIGSATGLLALRAYPHLVDTAGLYFPFNRHAIDRGVGEPLEKWNKSEYIFGPCGAAACYRREMIQAILIDGEFHDEHFFAYKEDVDVAWRAQLLGWKSYFEAQATGLHARGWKISGRKEVSLFVRQHSYANQIFMLIKNEQINASFLIRIFVLFGRELAKITYALVKERELLQSWGHIIRHIPIMYRKRKLLKKKIQKLTFK